MKTDTEIEAQIARGQQSARRVLLTLVVSSAICCTPIDWTWKVLPGCIAVGIFLCMGPVLILLSGGCGCGHPSCDVDNYWKRKNR